MRFLFILNRDPSYSLQTNSKKIGKIDIDEQFNEKANKEEIINLNYFKQLQYLMLLYTIQSNLNSL